MFDRYEKLATKQMEQATRRLEKYQKAQTSSCSVHNGDSEGLPEGTGETVTN